MVFQIRIYHRSKIVAVVQYNVSEHLSAYLFICLGSELTKRTREVLLRLEKYSGSYWTITTAENKWLDLFGFLKRLFCLTQTSMLCIHGKMRLGFETGKAGGSLHGRNIQFRTYFPYANFILTLALSWIKLCEWNNGNSRSKCTNLFHKTSDAKRILLLLYRLQTTLLSPGMVA